MLITGVSPSCLPLINRSKPFYGSNPGFQTSWKEPWLLPGGLRGAKGRKRVGCATDGGVILNPQVEGFSLSQGSANYDPPVCMLFVAAVRAELSVRARD